MLELERRERIEIPLAADFIRQSVGYRRLDAEEIAEGVAVFGLGQPPDDETPGILLAEVLQLCNPIGEHLPIRIAWLGRALRRHVMRLHLSDPSLPLIVKGGVTWVLERRRKIDPRLRGPPVLVARDAIGLDERRYAIAEERFGIGP